MEPPADNTIRGKKEASLSDKLAALIYYDRGAKKIGDPPHVVQFEDLPEEEQKPFIAEAIRFVIRLDKLNLMVVRKVSREEGEQKEAKALDTLVNIIKGFVGGLKTTRPDLFPCEELGRRILEGPKR